MSNARLKMALTTLSVPEFIIRCTAIKTAVEDNVATFATPVPSLATIDAAVQDLAGKQQAVEQKSGTDATFLRNEAKDALHDLMRQLATYVSGVANGNADIILLSGFDLVSSPSSVGLLPPPNTLTRQVDGQSTGTIRLSWKGVDRSSGYMVAIAPVEDGGVIGTWSASKAKRLSHIFTGLESGALYAMRVATLSSAGQGTWSVTVTYRPQ